MDDVSSQAGVRRRRPVRVRLTDRDRELLAFLAEHRLLLPAHVQTLLGVSPAAARARLRALASAGMVCQMPVFHRRPACIRIRPKGLAAIGSELPPPRIDLRCYEHDVGAAWLWLAARSGTFGPMRAVLSERRLRSHDAAPDRAGEPLAVRLGGFGPGGRERLHYPDLLLLDTDGRRIALELELTSKGRTRREQILAGYGADARIDTVLYLVNDRSVAQRMRSSAIRLGISPRVQVQLAQLPGPGGGQAAARVPERVRQGSRAELAL